MAVGRSGSESSSRPAWWPPSTVNSPVPTSSGSSRRPDVGERSRGAGDPLAGHVEVRRRLGLRAEHADPAVAEPEQVLDGHPSDGDVVDAHGREPGRLRADRHHAEPAPSEVGDVIGVESDLDEDQAVDTAVEGGRGVDCLAAGGGVRRGEHQQVVAGLGADRLGAGDDVGEVPRVDQRDDDGDGVAAARGQA